MGKILLQWKKKKTLLFLFVVLGVGILAVLPFFGNKFLPTHDGEYHIIRFMEFDRMIRQGYVFPTWAPTINSGYGLPLFEFMYPLPNYVASLLHFFGVEFVTAFKYSSACSYLLALVFCFFFLKAKWSLKSAVVGTIAAAFVPYWFVELYVRGSIGELWAITFLFLGLWGIEKKSFLLLTIASCLLVLSHNGLAMLFIPLLGVYTVRKLSFTWLLWIGIGIGASSWFWLPALMESKYMVGLNTVRATDHFVSFAELLIPSWGTEFSAGASYGNKMSLQIGVSVFLWVVYMIFKLKHVGKQEKHELFVVFAIILGSVFLLLPWSSWVWQHVIVITYLQYPWRLLVLVIPFTAFVAGCATRHAKKLLVPIILVCCSVLFSFSYTRGAQYEPRNDFYYQSRQNFTDGTSSMGNSLSTIYTPWKEERAVSLVTDTNNVPIQVTPLLEKYLDKTYRLTLENDTKVRFYILYFPGWTVRVDGVATTIDYKTNGTIDVMVSRGTHTVEVYMTKTPIQRLGIALSLVSLVLGVGLGILWYRRRK